MSENNESRTLSSSMSAGADDGAALRGTLDINRFLRSVAYASARVGRLAKRNLAPRVFTSGKLAVLKLLASQAAISPRNVQLDDELRRSEARVTGLGELSASIAHEVNQPLGAIMFNAEACVSWLDCNPPNLNEAHAALQRIFRDGTRAGEVIRRIRALAKNAETKMVPLDLDDVLSEALSFVQHELSSSRVAVLVEHAGAPPVILADRVQLQQVILNLVMNGIEALRPITDRPRELVIRTERDDAQYVRLTVTDCGVGFPTDSADRLFDTSFTTKSSGMGMGLSICRSIIELHGGHIWAVPNLPYGASIKLTLPLHPEASSR